MQDAINVNLLRSQNLQVFRVVLRKGEEFSEYAVPGEITVQCLEGLIELRIGQEDIKQLATGDLVYLEGGQMHALAALSDASVLVTVYHPRQSTD